MAEADTQAEVDGGTQEASADGDKTVPYKAFDAERSKRQSLERQIAELTGKVDGLTARPAAPVVETPRTLTRAQLDAAVAEGRLSQEAADATWEQQIERRAEAAAERTITARDTARNVETEIARYVAANPEINRPGTPARERVTREFNSLIAAGLPSSKGTELAALKAAFGPVEGLRAQPGARETHQETGSDGGSSERRPSGDGAPKDIPAANLAHYRQQIERGRYSGWKDPALVQELGYLRAKTGRRSAA